MQNACCFLCHYSSDIIANWCGLCFSHSTLYNLASTLHPMALIITCMVITLLHRFWQTYVLACLQLLMILSVCDRCVELLHYTDVDGVSLIPMARGTRLWLCTCGMISINAILCRDILSVWSSTAMMASKCEQANVNLFVWKLDGVTLSFQFWPLAYPFLNCKTDSILNLYRMCGMMMCTATFIHSLYGFLLTGLGCGFIVMFLIVQIFGACFAGAISG